MTKLLNSEKRHGTILLTKI